MVRVRGRGLAQQRARVGAAQGLADARTVEDSEREVADRQVEPEERVLVEVAEQLISPLYLRHISAISRLYLRYISAIARLVEVAEQLAAAAEQRARRHLARARATARPPRQG